ncbi:terminase large subunit [Clostridium perfringens]|uniref:terminase large subunit n=2 Tax=Clostridium perfringens TaxID=1502 RepID=UPI000707EA02|nr:terminase TerL endonuclease subunit [Clostridium perfringens]DAL54601.1 MAG TPA_asm: Large Terminase [Caudoviricetes sp.]KQC93967.1 terminase [Clostridium perfringens CP4]MCX0402761.1 terminase large subunit [Clostridium perfringens]MDM0934634.1 terminase large subunit [Clostridium perfringens]MDU7549204.1 terminase TerL endonuclease subunit [Clostridium perfringens]
MNRSNILEYYNKIQQGEIIVGRELMLQLKTLKKEIADPIYQKVNKIKIDFEDSEKRINFIQNECKHFEAPHAGKPFILEIWQKAFVEAIFAIKIWDDELGKYVRKYQDVLFLVGRKNGKTPFISAICLSEWFCGEMGKKILCASNDYEQADLMFQAINSMREESKTLEKVTRKNIKGIFFGNPKQKKKKGKFSYQNKGNIRKLSAKSGAKEGRNIGVGAVDEVFEMKDDTTVMPIRQALSTQDEPLYFELTTEGFTQGGYLDDRLIDARKVLNGELERPRWLIWLCTQDSEQEVWQDESSWVKSNPGLGKIKKWSFLRNMIEEAKTSNSKRAFVLAKDFNIKQNGACAWLQAKDIENDLTFEIEELEGCIALGATDLSETTDLTNARVMVLKNTDKPGIHMKYMYTMYFIPESKLGQVSREDREKYKKWAKDGWLTICAGNEVDYSDVVAWYVSLYRKYNIRVFKAGYDRWNAKSFVSEMEDYGFDLEKIPQDVNNLSNPMKKLEADLKDNLVNYNQNPIDKWCLENVSIKIDELGRIMPVKVQDIKLRHIDGAVTMIICYAVLDRFKRDYLYCVK